MFFCFIIFFILESCVKVLVRGKSLEKEKQEAIEKILSLAVHSYVRFRPCSSDNSGEGLKAFLEQLTLLYDVILRYVWEGSVVIILACHTLEGLELLWKDYRSGHLDKVAERYLISEEIKRKLNLETTSLETVIEEENYSNCRKALMKLPSTSSGEYKQNVREIQLCCTGRRFCLAFQFQECTIYKKYIGRTGRKPNFVVGSLSFPISAPVHDDSGKFRHVFRSISRKWRIICRGKSRMCNNHWAILALTCCFRQNQNNNK